MTKPVRILWPIAFEKFRIDPALVGKTIALGIHDSVSIELILPRDVDDSLISGKEWPREARATVTHADATGQATVVTVNQAVVRARTSSDMDRLETISTDYKYTEEDWAAVEALRTSATTIADRVLNMFVDHVAITRRTFGVSMTKPPTTTQSQLYVGSAKDRIRFGFPSETMTIYSGLTGLSPVQARSLSRKVRAGSEPPLEWQLYREAHRRFYIDEDPRPALVEAASAVEIGVKAALRRKAAQRGVRTDPDMVSWMNDLARLGDLLKRGAATVLGESYADADKTNYDLVDGLLNQRHRLVHRGIDPSVDDLRRQMPAALAFLEWLSSKAPY